MIEDFLKQEIKHKGLTMMYVSKMTSIPYQRLSRVFNSKGKLTAYEFLKVSNLLQIPSDSLYKQLYT